MTTEQFIIACVIGVPLLIAVRFGLGWLAYRRDTRGMD